MVVLIVFIVLVIFGTFITVSSTRGKEDTSRILICCIPIQFFTMIFILISLVAPANYTEKKLEAEYELVPIIVNATNEYYVIRNEYSYTCDFGKDTNVPEVIPIENVTSVVYINDGETAKFCHYVQRNDWTWYSAPIKKDIVTSVLYVPKGSIKY